MGVGHRTRNEYLEALFSQTIVCLRSFVLLAFAGPPTAVLGADLVPVSNIDVIYIVTVAHADVVFNAPPSVRALNNHHRAVTGVA